MHHQCNTPPVQVDPFLRQLSRAVLGVDVGLIPHHLHPFSPSALLTAVLADHVQLPYPVLEVDERVGTGYREVRRLKTGRKREKKRRKKKNFG